MRTAWDGVRPDDAETQLRGLDRRLSELDEALHAAQSMLRERPQSFSARLSINSLSKLQERLQNERSELVKNRKYEILSLALKGAAFAGGSAPIGNLGIFLIRIQKLFSSIGQAITSGPRLRGPISREIVSATEIRFAESYASSFGMKIFIDSNFDMFGESVAVSSLETLFSLLNATDKEQEIARVSAELGQRSLAHLRHVLEDLEKTDSGFVIDWSDIAGRKYTWSADAAKIPSLRSHMAQYRERRISQRMMDGILLGASLLRDRFEFLDDYGHVFEGKVTRSVKPSLLRIFGRRCRVEVDQVDVIDIVSQETRSYFTMTNASPLPNE